jgi:excisionase family DNA binding protein
MIETNKAVLLTVAEAAARLGMDLAQLRRYLRDSRIAGVKYGRDWMIRENDLVSFQKSYKPTTGRPRGSKNTKRELKKT